MPEPLPDAESPATVIARLEALAAALTELAAKMRAAYALDLPAEIKPPVVPFAAADSQKISATESATA